MEGADIFRFFSCLVMSSSLLSVLAIALGNVILMSLISSMEGAASLFPRRCSDLDLWGGRYPEALLLVSLRDDLGIGISSSFVSRSLPWEIVLRRRVSLHIFAVCLAISSRRFSSEGASILSGLCVCSIKLSLRRKVLLGSSYGGSCAWASPA